MPALKNPSTITVSGITFTVRSGLLTLFPEARKLLEDLLARDVSGPVALHYVKLAARLRKQGRLDRPELVTHNVERTAANAYWRWAAESYQKRVQPVILAFANSAVRDGLGWLRRGSIVPPYPGKNIPRITAMSQLDMNSETKNVTATAPTLGWFPCDTWTLHVPSADVPAHPDPCIHCTPIELDAAKLEVLAQAFEATWGHRDLGNVPSECLLFGERPRGDVSKDALVPLPAGKIVALLGPGALADALGKLRGAVARDLESFDARLKEGADVLVISRDVIGDARFEDVALSVQSVITEALWVERNPHTDNVTAIGAHTEADLESNRPDEVA